MPSISQPFPPEESEETQGGNKRAKLKKFKIRYVGLNKQALDAIEEKYSSQVEFPR